jgi:CDGSH-type Zn-finger protein
VTDPGGREARPTILACPNGPLLVRGEVEILSTTGEEIPKNRKTIALCRCGASTIKPYCDGTHKLVNFRTEPPESESPAGGGR